jgi:arabinose-5-phosphate isomerase
MNALTPIIALAEADPTAWALDVLHGEVSAMLALLANPPLHLGDVIVRVAAARRPVLCCGAGKSGLVAAKVAATMASLGTPAFSLSAADAAHGDLGAVMPGSTIILFSNSGTTAELLRILPNLRALGCHVIGLVGCAHSPLGRAVDTLVDVPVPCEADHLGLAPTASTTLQMAVGDAIAVAASRLRGFTHSDFLRAHPAGQLGRRALPVTALMRQGEALPAVLPHMTLAQAASTMSSGMIGAACVVDGHGRLQGLIVDGDMRRAVQARLDLYTITAADAMRPNPLVLAHTASVGDAVDMMQAGLMVLPVVDDAGCLLGILHSLDLVQNS